MESQVLYTLEYLVGHLDNIDNLKLKANILRNYEGRNFMEDSPEDIRYEDIRLDLFPEVKKLMRTLMDKFEEQYGLKIKPVPTSDQNEVVWAVVHQHNESTNWHDHATHTNYNKGAKVSAVYYVDVPHNSGDIVFKVHENPFVTKMYLEKAETGKFIMFDSTLLHCVTKNLSNYNRIIISMNFTFDD
jgi:hypothetical protein